MKQLSIISGLIILVSFSLHLLTDQLLPPDPYDDEVTRENVLMNRFIGNYNVGFPVLTYQEFSESSSEEGAVSEAVFREHLEALQRAGYTSITEERLVLYKNGNREALPEKPLLITMDDGYKSNYEVAYPVLEEMDMNATIFTVAGRRDQGVNNHFTWEEAREMVESGNISIQSKTYDLHDRVENEEGEEVSSLTYRMPEESDEAYRERVREDLELSVDRIEEEVGNEVTTLSLPYGDYNEEVLEISEDLGIELFFSTYQNLNTEENLERGMMYRFGVEPDMSGRDLVQMLEQTMYVD
ncbi:polysaccharide deacetylase family protein [Alkalicoccus halolimnae]|uniref:Polysaccharide deacetylase family protein n=1 Tax=Alkalicoccus halolimnae TaxID=1667239 RepID=A0A5C7FJB3_9BACI|nr:polysaccharide deacetylase family protein [Alkalicoccus halolimnae]TXF85516.1 polysaccharide deacetylase family protein [Alkalicoccus halolimnae]